MRRSRTLVFAVAALAAVGLLGETVADAASDGTLKLQTSGGSGGSPAASSSGSPRGSAGREVVAAALATLAAGGSTLAGPGHFLGRIDDETRIYEVLGGAAVDACVTVRNLSGRPIRVNATGASSIEVDSFETRAFCYAAPTLIQLECREGAFCEGVWRVDRR